VQSAVEERPGLAEGVPPGVHRPRPARYAVRHPTDVLLDARRVPLAAHATHARYRPTVHHEREADPRGRAAHRRSKRPVLYFGRVVLRPARRRASTLAAQNRIPGHPADGPGRVPRLAPSARRHCPACTHASRRAVYTLQKADLIIALGSRPFDDR